MSKKVCLIEELRKRRFQATKNGEKIGQEGELQIRTDFFEHSS